jgi:GAF domain-containing protein
VAVAISNAQLFQQIQENLETTQQAYGTLAGKAWRDLFQKPSALSFLSDQDGTRPADGLWEPQMEAAYQTESLTPGAQAGAGPGTLAIPLRVRDQVIGVVDGRKPASQGEWQPEEIELLKTLVEQLEVALESASLYQDMQRRAVREQLVGQVTSRMRQTLDVEGVLRTAIEETRHALGLPEVIVRLRDPASIPDRKPIIDHGGNGRDQEPSA